MAVLNTIVKDHFVVLTIDRPQSLNAINTEVMQSLYDFFHAERGNKSIHGVIITGAGEKAFVAGADISGFQLLTADNAKDLPQLGHDAYDAIENFHVPVIAAVNGFALGGGCELAMACHLRIATPNAKFGQPEVNLGLIPGYGGTQRLPQLVGKGRALQMLLTGDMIDAQTALQWGLVNKLVEEGEVLLDVCMAWLGKIAGKGPKAIEAIIGLASGNFAGKDGFVEEVEHFSKLLLDGEGKEGTSAFLEKRKADFRKI